MRRDLEDWLKGKSEILKGLEAPGKYAGLPVVRLSTSSDKAPFRPSLEGSLALLPRSAPTKTETEEHGEPLAAPEPSVPPAAREEANPVSSK